MRLADGNSRPRRSYRLQWGHWYQGVKPVGLSERCSCNPYRFICGRLRRWLLETYTIHINSSRWEITASVLTSMSASDIAMSTKSANLTTALARCRYCQRYWQPGQGVVASRSYCSYCSESRRSIAAKNLGLKSLTQADESERYMLPRSLR